MIGFFTSNKKDENTSRNFEIEQPILTELEDEEVMIEKEILVMKHVMLQPLMKSVKKM